MSIFAVAGKPQSGSAELHAHVHVRAPHGAFAPGWFHHRFSEVKNIRRNDRRILVFSRGRVSKDKWFLAEPALFALAPYDWAVHHDVR